MSFSVSTVCMYTLSHCYVIELQIDRNLQNKILIQKYICYYQHAICFDYYSHLGPEDQIEFDTQYLDLSIRMDITLTRMIIGHPEIGLT